jgi:hypothetical protein
MLEFTRLIIFLCEVILCCCAQLPGDLQYKERDSLDPMLDDLLEAKTSSSTSRIKYQIEKPISERPVHCYLQVFIRHIIFIKGLPYV